MPIKKFDSHAVELHLGILQQKIERLKGKARACAFKADPEHNLEGVDIEAEKLKFQDYEQKAVALEDELAIYENKVLGLTEL